MQKTYTGSWNDDSDWIEKNDLQGYDDYDKSFSDYWLPKMPEKKGENDIQRLVRLSQIQKSIGNFVRILTGKGNIRVRFHTKSSSFTDGETVTISANVSDKNYDTSVGLALHEASHCSHTDFNLFKNVQSFIPARVYTRAEALGYPRVEITDSIRNLFNWIEDRRIDNLTYHTHPGYKGYYASLYTEYFRNKEINEGLRSSEFRQETIASYLFRIVNLMNENSDLDALRGLRNIYRSIDLKHIGRLKSSRHSFDTAIEVFEEMLSYLEIKKVPKKVKMKLPKNMKNQTPTGAQPDILIEDEDDSDEDDEGMGSSAGSSDDEKESKSGSSDEKDSDDDEKDSDNSDDEKESKDSPEKSDEKTDDKEDEKGAEAADLDKGEADEYDENEVTEGDGELSDKMKSKLDKAMKEIKELLDGQTAKTSIKEKDRSNLDMIDKSGTSIEEVVVKDSYSDFNVPVTVIRNVSMDYFSSDMCPFSTMSYYGKYDKGRKAPMQEYVDRGVQLGKMLGRKLQIRNEVRIERDIRKDHGHINKRMLSALGYDYENVFYQQREDKYARAIIHLSIDDSGSMGGARLGRAIQTAVAIAKFCEMNQTLDCVISLRASDANAWIALIYDSRKDKFNKITSMFPFLRDTGGTPEGLTFAAIQKEIESSSNDITSYFINLSDGEPAFGVKGHSYSGDVAHKHTRRMVENMKQRGIIVLAYFITDAYDSWASYGISNFKAMYGESAATINVNALPELAHSLERMFLQKKR